MKIKIYKNNLKENHILYMNYKKYDYVLADTHETSYKAKRFIFKVCDMVKDWPSELKDENILDGLEYKIVIKKSENEQKIFTFKNKFPKDIYRLEMLFEEVLEEVLNV